MRSPRRMILFGLGALAPVAVLLALALRGGDRERDALRQAFLSEQRARLRELASTWKEDLLSRESELLDQLATPSHAGPAGLTASPEEVRCQIILKPDLSLEFPPPLAVPAPASAWKERFSIDERGEELLREAERAEFVRRRPLEAMNHYQEVAFWTYGRSLRVRAAVSYVALALQCNDRARARRGLELFHTDLPEPFLTPEQALWVRKARCQLETEASSGRTADLWLELHRELLDPTERLFVASTRNIVLRELRDRLETMRREGSLSREALAQFARIQQEEQAAERRAQQADVLRAWFLPALRQSLNRSSESPGPELLHFYAVVSEEPWIVALRRNMNAGGRRLGFVWNNDLLASGLGDSEGAAARDELTQLSLVDAEGRHLAAVANTAAPEGREELLVSPGGELDFLRVRAWVDPGAHVGAQDVRCALEVEDRGAGIPPDEREKVRQRFFRGRKALERRARGTGLGLALVDEIVAAHGGTLVIEAVAEGGTRVRLLLPHSGGESS